MLSKIIKYFEDMNMQIHRTKELAGFARKDVSIMREDIKEMIEYQKEWNRSFQKTQAALVKSLSSLELEMLIQRGACLDNNFEGKEDM